MQDLHNNIGVENGFTAAVINSDTTTAGAIIDLDGVQAVEWVMEATAYTDGTYTPLIEDGEDSGLSDAAAVADAQLLGTEAGAALAAAGLSRIGYVGGKRYARLSWVSTATTTGATLNATVVTGHYRHAPVA